MTPRHFLLLATLALLPFAAQAQVALGEPTLTASPNKALVEVPMQNRFEQPIKAARIWIVMLDDDGKIVGQKAQWLTGKDKDNKPLKEGELDLQPSGENDEMHTYSVSIDTTRPATQTKVTFSRIVLADGTLANINKDIIPAKFSQLPQTELAKAPLQP